MDNRELSQEELDVLINSVEYAEDLALIYHEYMQITTLYSNSNRLTMPEAHALSMIANNPGIIQTELAKKWGCTRSSTSKLVNKLVRKGYVEQKLENGNKKNQHLYPTELGTQLEKEHIKFDYELHAALIQRLLRFHTPDELETYFEVTKTFIKYFD